MNTFHANRTTFHGCLQPLPLTILRRIAVALLALSALASGVAGFCGPIHDAVRDGDLAKVKTLLTEHPDLASSKDEKFGQTPLHVAALNDRLDVAKLLVASKADVNAAASNGSTPLHLAAAKGNKDIAELLLNSKADVNAVDHDGWSPLHSAITYGRKEMEDYLRQQGGQDLPAKPSSEKAAPKESGKDGQFTAYDDGTVVDTKTNLMWAARDNGTSVSWPKVKAFADSSRVAGYTDWRLPTLAELSALYDPSKNRRTYCQTAVDEMGAMADEVHITDLIRLSCPRVWTSQERADKPGSYTIFDFHGGKDAARPGSDDFIDTASRVLLVRPAKR
jgi:ankyrin repeat protein